MRRLLVCFLLLPALSWVQRSDTVFEIVATGVAASPYTSPVVRNIGQPFHVFFVRFSDAAGQTCTAVSTTFATPTTEIRATHGTAGFYITHSVRVLYPGYSVAADRYRMLVSAPGAHPSIQLYLSGFDTAKCVADIYYSGTLSTLDMAHKSDFKGSFFDETLVVPVNTGASPQSIVVTTTNVRIMVYAFSLCNGHNATQNITLQDLRTDKVTVQLAIFNLAPGTCVLGANNGTPYFRTSIGGELQVATSVATPATGFVIHKQE